MKPIYFIELTENIFIKIVIIAILFDTTARCSPNEGTPTELKPLNKSFQHGPDYNAYNVREIPQYTEKTTIIGVNKLLQVLEKELETHNKSKYDSVGSAKFSVLNGIHNLVSNIVRKNVDPIMTEKEYSTQSGIMAPPRTAYESVTMTNIKAKYGSGSKQVGSIMKTPRKFNDTQKESSIDSVELESEAETSFPERDAESTTEFALEDIVSFEFEKEQDGESNINSTNPIGENVNKAITIQVNQVHIEEEHEEEWFPQTIAEIFSRLQIKSKDNNSLCNLQYSFYQRELRNLSHWAVQSKWFCLHQSLLFV